MFGRKKKEIQSIMGIMGSLLVLVLSGCNKINRLIGQDNHEPNATGSPSLWIIMGQSNANRMGNHGGGEAFENKMGHGSVVLNCALDGSYIDQWAVNKKSFNTCLEMTNSYLAKYATASVAGILYYQGESDAMGPADDPTITVHTKDYAQVLMQNFTDYRFKLGNYDLPIIFAQIATNTKNYPDWELIKQQQASVQQANTVMIKTDDLPLGDSVHLEIPYSTTICGERFAEAALKFLGR